MDHVAGISRYVSVGGSGLFLVVAMSCSSDSKSPDNADNPLGGSGGAAAGAGGAAGAPPGGAGAPLGAGGTTPPAPGAGGASVGGASAGGASASSGGAPGAGGAPPPGGMTGMGGAVTGAGGDAPGAGGGENNGAGGARPTGDFCLQAGSGDFNQDGPYQTATEDVEIGSSGMYTIWYPTQFESNCKHPMVVWGNGTTVTGSAVYAFFNLRAASWGAVAIGSHNSNVGSGEFHRAAIDYLLAQNEDPSSKFYQKLSGRAGVSGHSQGGFGAAAAASHPNVEAFVPVGASGNSRGLPYLCLTGTADIAPASCKSTVQSAQGPAMAAIWEGGDHVTTETLAGWIAGDPGTKQMTRLYAAWFRCYLADDPVACGLFAGGNPSCTICTDPGWSEVVTNNL